MSIATKTRDRGPGMTALRKALPVWLLFGSGLLLAPIADRLEAQVIHGQLARDGSSEPIGGALVVLLGADGTQLTGALTNPEGRFTIRAPGPGVYTLRAEQIGFATVTSPALRLADAETLEYSMLARVEPVRMDGLTVTGRRRRCVVRPREGEQLHTLWEEARKALNAAAWTEEQGLFRFRYVRYERELDPASLRVRTHREVATAGLSANPFVSIPAEQLENEGYVRMSGADAWYFAPDAEVLLSDRFLDQHCFKLASGRPDAEGLIGLAFEPVSGRGLPDIEGVLWLHRSTAELHHLEYRYTRLSIPVATDELGGRIDFERLPTGAWIIRRWYIRMPVIGTSSSQWLDTGSRTSHTLLALKEDGGEVVAIFTPAGRVVRSASLASISGTVFDSITSAPLAGAEVFVVGGADDRSLTDASGRFLITGLLPERSYRLSFSHPRLDSLDYSPAGLEVAVVGGEGTDVALAIPSMATMRAAECGDAEGGVVFGSVVNSANSLPLAGARVTLSAPGDSFVREQESDFAGRYLFCGVPAEVALTVRATAAGSARTGHLQVARAGAPIRHDLALSLHGAVVRTEGGSVYRATHQPVRVEGVARDAETSGPLPEARVRIRAQDGQPMSLPDRSTDSRGRFVFASVPPGAYVVEVLSPGYDAYEAPLVIGGGGGMELELLVPPPASGRASADEADHEVITTEELRRANAANVYEVVEALHPRWLRKPGPQSFYNERDIVVYLDTGRIGGPDALREIPTASVVSIRYYDLAAANYRFGPGHPHGVIQVRTGR
jgi:hypothetical protein